MAMACGCGTPSTQRRRKMKERRVTILGCGSSSGPALNCSTCPLRRRNKKNDETLTQHTKPGCAVAVFIAPRIFWNIGRSAFVPSRYVSDGN